MSTGEAEDFPHHFWFMLLSLVDIVVRFFCKAESESLLAAVVLFVLLLLRC